MIAQKLAAQQKAYQAISLDVLKAGWEADLAMIELEGHESKRVLAEKQFERASKGLMLDDRAEQQQQAVLNSGPSVA